MHEVISTIKRFWAVSGLRGTVFSQHAQCPQFDPPEPRKKGGGRNRIKQWQYQVLGSMPKKKALSSSADGDEEDGHLGRTGQGVHS